MKKNRKPQANSPVIFHDDEARAEFIHFAQTLQLPPEGADPIRNYLQQVSLEHEELRIAFEADFKAWFLDYVKEILFENFINTALFCIYGKQGCGKSRFVRSLVPLKYYNSRYCNYYDEHIGTSWIVEISEGTKIDRTIMSKLLAVGEVVRMPYTNVMKNRYRTESYVLTGNSEIETEHEDGVTIYSYGITDFEQMAGMKIEDCYAWAIMQLQQMFLVKNAKAE